MLTTTHPGIRIFIFSSYAGRAIAARLGVQLTSLCGPRNWPQPTMWTDYFPSLHGTHFFEIVNRALSEFDFFLCVLTPDLSMRNESGAETKHPSDNVILELGLATGRRGMESAVVVTTGDVHKPSDLKGIQLYELNVDDEMHMTAVAEYIVNHVADIALNPNRRDGRSRWLTLVKCRPLRQHEMATRVKQHEARFLGKRVRLEASGVLWGYWDYFLLHSSPSDIVFQEFIKEFRDLYSGLVRYVDSRMVFPSKYWCRAGETAGVGRRWLVLLSCLADKVEELYQGMVDTALLDTGRARITHAGIIAGGDDIFALVECDKEDDYQRIIEESPAELNIRADYLWENTTSLVVT